MVQVYGKPQCVQCEYTKKRLDAADIPYEYHDITAEPEAMKVVEQTGKLQLPLVIAGDQTWHGLSPDRIAALSAQTHLPPYGAWKQLNPPSASRHHMVAQDRQQPFVLQ